MENSITNILTSIKQKIAKLQLAKENLQKENIVLKEKLEEANSRDEKRNKKILELQSQVHALQLTQSTMDAAEKTRMEKVIDKHIQAIEKSIALLTD